MFVNMGNYTKLTFSANGMTDLSQVSGYKSTFTAESTLTGMCVTYDGANRSDIVKDRCA